MRRRLEESLARLGCLRDALSAVPIAARLDMKDIRRIRGVEQRFPSRLNLKRWSVDDDARRCMRERAQVESKKMTTKEKDRDGGAGSPTCSLLC